MGALLALASAVFYGIADYAGGLLSRRAGFAVVALTGQLGGLVLTASAAPFVPAPGLDAADAAWGALSGVGTGAGMLFLYRGLSRGAMSVVVPVSAVGGVALPVVAGVVLLGDRPSAVAWPGILVAVPALWLVSRPRTGTGSVAGVPDALVAGAGIALQYLALAQAGPESGIWPVVAGRLAAVITVLPLVRSSGERHRPPRGILLPAAATGAVAALALVCYLLAAGRELLTVAVVLSSLYPVVPVLLGVTRLRERLTGLQTAGLGGAGLAIALLTLA
ncbi:MULTISPECIES: EamA family transporter [Streptomyces]|uniref:DMT family transporter n=1 Tax=Streptomyces lycii TaxID=2654337 RepID=A0ABQ7FRN2_9ACTN|nr:MULTISPECIES: EamA family transporter [Streptomyces]KAF4410923.1 DMT family transporter [Streptomyces lycii]PGH48897.1 multidrug DMT transporter permease [Streptomyces sp. Ru87]